MVERALRPLRLSPADRRRVVRLVTLRARLPQGAPTSPHVANLVTRDLDVSLSALAGGAGWRYTRYADDLTFSGEGDPKPLMRALGDLVGRAGFRLRPGKTRLMSQGTRQLVTGLVVNDHVAVPRLLRRRLRRFAADGLRFSFACRLCAFAIAPSLRLAAADGSVDPDSPAPKGTKAHPKGGLFVARPRHRFFGTLPCLRNIRSTDTSKSTSKGRGAPAGASGEVGGLTMRRKVEQTPGPTASAIIAGLLAFLMGCQSGSKQPKSRLAPPEGDAASQPSVLAQAIRYVVCPEREAETAMVTELTVKDVLSHRQVFGLKKAEPPSSSSHGMGSADGPRGSYNVSINIVEGSDSDVTARIWCYWRLDGKEGEIEQRDVVVPVGKAVDLVISDGAKFTASFRKPWPAPTTKEVPRLVQELGGPDDNQAIWDLVEVGEPAIPVLLSAIRGPQKERRLSAIWALGHIASKSEKAVPGILASLQDADKDVRARAARVCLWVPGQAVTRALEAATKDADPDVARAAKLTLAHKDKARTSTQPATRSSSPAAVP